MMCRVTGVAIVLVASVGVVCPVQIPKPIRSSHVLLDRIVARVNGRNILLSDLQMPQVSRDGRPYVAEHVIVTRDEDAYTKGLEQAIDDELLFSRAVERKLVPNDQDIEKRIVSMKMSYGLGDLTDKEFEVFVRRDGLTLDLYKRQLAKILSRDQLRQAEASERLVVTQHEKQDYYRTHPEYVEQRFVLRLAQFTTQQLADQQDRSKSALLARKDLVWQELPALSANEISERLRMVFTMEPGDISQPIATSKGVELVMFADKDEGRRKTFEEQEPSITRHLFEQKSIAFESKLLAELRSAATIVYV